MLVCLLSAGVARGVDYARAREVGDEKYKEEQIGASDISGVCEFICCNFCI